MTAEQIEGEIQILEATEKETHSKVKALRGVLRARQLLDAEIADREQALAERAKKAAGKP